MSFTSPETTSLDWVRVRVIAVDAVGTLLRADPPVAEAYVRVGQAHGIELTADSVKARFAEAFQRYYASRGGRSSEEEERSCWRRIVGCVFADCSTTEVLFEELWDHFASPKSWRLFEDAERFVARLAKAEVKTLVASNFDQRLIDISSTLLPGLGVVTSSAAGFRKPHRGFYDFLAQHAGVTTAELLMIGDDHANDYQGAKSAGCQAVWLDRNNSQASSATHITSLDQLSIIPR